MFDFLKPFVRGRNGSSTRQPAKQRGTDELSSLEVTEGNTHADWHLWDDSVMALERQMHSGSHELSVPPEQPREGKAPSPARSCGSAKKLPVVVEGNTEADWNLWYDSVRQVATIQARRPGP